MKNGIFIYQAPPGLGRNIITSAGSLGSVWFGTKGSKREMFIDKLNKKLAKLGYPVNITEDKTEANLEEIASRNYDFIICTPDLRKKVVPSDELQPIIYLESLEFHNTIVEPVINKIQKLLNN